MDALPPDAEPGCTPVGEQPGDTLLGLLGLQRPEARSAVASSPDGLRRLANASVRAWRRVPLLCELALRCDEPQTRDFVEFGDMSWTRHSGFWTLHSPEGDYELQVNCATGQLVVEEAGVAVPEPADELLEPFAADPARFDGFAVAADLADTAVTGGATAARLDMLDIDRRLFPVALVNRLGDTDPDARWARCVAGLAVGWLRSVEDLLVAASALVGTPQASAASDSPVIVPIAHPSTSELGAAP